MFLPSMILSLGELAPDIAANVGSISSVLVMALLTVFAGIFPGQRTTQGLSLIHI